MRILLAVIALALAGACLDATAHAAGDPRAMPDSRTELVVFEAEGCDYCLVFRRNIAVLYSQTPQARRAPMRFVDVNEAAAAGLRLRGPITLAPTVVIIRDGEEIDRIAGYTAPDLFFSMIRHAIRPLD